MRVDDQLNELLRQAVGPLDPTIEPASLRWEVPKDPTFGDLSSPISFRLASKQGQAPQQLAERLVTVLQDTVRRSPLDGLVERLEAKRGFVNVFLSQQALTQILAQINRATHQYGTSRLGQGKAVLIEFVSANPTGPLSVAHGRQAAVGDALARVLGAQGYRVVREYFLNDEGRQIELLGRSLQARYAEFLGQAIPFPEEGYRGAYLYEVAKAFHTRYGARFLDQLDDSSLSRFVAFGIEAILREIQQDLIRFRLRFDRWVSQRWLRTSGRIDRALVTLKRRGALYEQDDALWFASTKFGDDKDRVVQKRTGELTYLAPDIAYHHWKFERGFSQLVNLWGPDHHGYIPRLVASVQALGLPAERLVIRIVQLVTLSRHGKPIPMSKRQGEFVTLGEVLDEVGVDATRFFYLMRTLDSHLEFDLDLAKAKVQENPVYYVQYAHARIWSILTYASQQLSWRKRRGPADLSRLAEPEERLLLRQLFQFPMVVRLCAQSLDPHGLTIYLQKLAELFHVFYTQHRVVSEDIPLSRARLALVHATQWVLANGLGLLGVSAPKRM